MSELITIAPSALPLPSPRIEISIRAGTMGDIPFIDALQKKQSREVGFFPTKAIEGKINAGHVLIAEHSAGSAGGPTADNGPQALTGGPQADPSRVGYLIGQDQYFKRDDVGIIYQMNVLPEHRRSFVAANLLKAQFERSAYGCRLYCCWCAQDIEANRFWESMGFSAIAYRAGGLARAAGSARRGKNQTPRVHLFWQKRIRDGDTATPWWFPSKTTGGAIGADRIVLPILPGTHWSDAKPLILPGTTPAAKALPEPRPRTKPGKKIETPAPVLRNGLMFDIPKQGEPLPEATRQTKPAKGSNAKPKTQKTQRVCDPRLASAARELRDRWLEQVNAGDGEPAPTGRYDVRRTIAREPTLPTLPSPIAA